jgi:hypothetical protein
MLKGAIDMKEKEIIKLRQSIVTNLEHHKIINSDMIDSLADYILGLSLIKDSYVKAKHNSESLEAAKKKYIRACIHPPVNKSSLGTSISSSAVEQTLETLNRMAEKGQLIKGVDFDSTKKVDDELCLRLNYTAFYDRFQKYCWDNKITHEVLSLKDFKKELQKKDYCLDYNKPVAFRTDDSLKEIKTFRAAVLSVERLNEMNLKIDYLIG